MEHDETSFIVKKVFYMYYEGFFFTKIKKIDEKCQCVTKKKKKKSKNLHSTSKYICFTLQL